MKKIISLLIVGYFFVVPSSLILAKEVKQGSPLYGLVVIIDPGHGGNDPGANAVFNEQPVNEDEYCYDVALRLERMVRAKGAIAVLTLRDKKQLKPVANKPADIIPPDSNEKFSINNSIVVARTKGTSKRVAYANFIKKKYPKHKMIFISIHFDVLPKEMEGVRIIESAKGTKIGKLLTDSFSSERRMEKGDSALFRSGDEAHGIVNAYVLRDDKNFIKEKVLLELGNFSNPKDVWRIRDYKVRENYAQLITRALIKLMK